MVGCAALLLGALGVIALLVSSLALRVQQHTTITPTVLNEGGTLGQPRILTVLTTYDKRSALVKEYKEAVLDRQDGYHPAVRYLVFSRRLVRRKYFNYRGTRCREAIYARSIIAEIV